MSKYIERTIRYRVLENRQEYENVVYNVPSDKLIKLGMYCDPVTFVPMFYFVILKLCGMNEFYVAPMEFTVKL